jgi:cytidylate kinase
MGVITISRKMGSLGSVIGNDVAEKLGMKCVKKDFIAEIMKEYGFARFNEIYDNVPSFWERYNEVRVDTVAFAIKVMEALGHHGNLVIVGRGGFEIFNDYRDVLNVRLDAPKEIRIGRKMLDDNLTKKEAKKYVEQHDKARKAFLTEGFKRPYDDTNDFDLVLNTGYIETDVAVTAICDAYKGLLKNGRNSDSKSLRYLKIDSVLEKLIEQKIAQL